MRNLIFLVFWFIVVRIWYGVKGSTKQLKLLFQFIIQISNHLLIISRPGLYSIINSSLLNLIAILGWKGYFRFPFYGHEVDKVYVTTGGFLSLSSRIHSFIYKIQYIAPLRLKLDPSLSEESEISYKLTENNLTVEWKRMKLQNASSKKQGETTFQVRDFTEILSRHLKTSSDVFTN